MTLCHFSCVIMSITTWHCVIFHVLFCTCLCVNLHTALSCLFDFMQSQNWDIDPDFRNTQSKFGSSKSWEMKASGGISTTFHTKCRLIYIEVLAPNIATAWKGSTIKEACHFWHILIFHVSISIQNCHFPYGIVSILTRDCHLTHGTVLSPVWWCVTFYMVLCHFAHRIVISCMVMCHFPHGIVISHMVMSRRAWPKGSSARFTYHSRTCVLFYRTCVYHRWNKNPPCTQHCDCFGKQLLFLSSKEHLPADTFIPLVCGTPHYWHLYSSQPRNTSLLTPLFLSADKHLPTDTNSATSAVVIVIFELCRLTLW